MLHIDGLLPLKTTTMRALGRDLEGVPLAASLGHRVDLGDIYDSAGAVGRIIDTTAAKAITFPTDAKLLHAAIKALNRLARRHGVGLRQSYSRVAKAAAIMAGRYAHAKQFKRHQRQLRILRSRLGRLSATSAARSRASEHWRRYSH